ncbi:MAG: hypothetical protein LBS11_05075 [Oscillospiraceae bacterium]|nr:hypothetical protein [Oscillospiraceae bacterium]
MSQNVGGIVGDMFHNGAIHDCLSTGAVMSEQGIVGGIAGMVGERVEVTGNVTIAPDIIAASGPTGNIFDSGDAFIHRVVGRMHPTADGTSILDDNGAYADMRVTGDNFALDDVFDYDRFLDPGIPDLEYTDETVAMDDPNYGITRMHGLSLGPCAIDPDSCGCVRLVSPCCDANTMNEYTRYMRGRVYGTRKGVGNMAMLWEIYMDCVSPRYNCNACSSVCRTKLVLLGLLRSEAIPVSGLVYDLSIELSDGSLEPLAQGVTNKNGVMAFEGLQPGNYIARMPDMEGGRLDYSTYMINIGENCEVSMREERFLEDALAKL